MLKSFILLSAGGLISSVVGEKTTIVNTSNSPLTIIEDNTAQALVDIEPEVAHKVLNALFSIPPGGMKVLQPNKYILDLPPVNGSAVLYVEKTAKAPAKKEKPKAEPVTPVIPQTNGPGEPQP